MDPLSAVGAVASVVQLAGAALSLSQTLYSLGTAVASAGEDVQALADDLKTFSQSLTLLSRLLEDSKCWYSDDIYLLTAKIIKDCSELYVKIDKVLVKLGGHGKSTWKLRVKFVYKEGQIRKLLSRLRDMKGTLATILMSLQVDLQLSLLNISSSSKIQRVHEQPLLPETIETLKDAQKAVESNVIVSRYAIPEKLSHYSEKGSQVFTTQYDVATTHVSAQSNFIVLPSISAYITKRNRTEPTKEVSSWAPNSTTNAASQPAASQSISQISSLGMKPPMAKGQCALPTTVSKRTSYRSLKSSSSVESFQSALSSQGTSTDIIDDVVAVQGVLHSFRTALETLNSFTQKRIPKKDNGLYPVVKDIERSLVDGEKGVSDTHKSHYKKHGLLYIQSFKDTDEYTLQNVSTVLLEEVVLVLHKHSAEHVVLQKSEFVTLYHRSEICRVRAISQLNQISSSLGGFRNSGLINCVSSKTSSQQSQYELPPMVRNSQPGLRSRPKGKGYEKPKALASPPLFWGIHNDPLGTDQPRAQKEPSALISPWASQRIPYPSTSSEVTTSTDSIYEFATPRPLTPVTTVSAVSCSQDTQINFDRPSSRFDRMGVSTDFDFDEFSQHARDSSASPILACPINSGHGNLFGGSMAHNANPPDPIPFDFDSFLPGDSGTSLTQPPSIGSGPSNLFGGVIAQDTNIYNQIPFGAPLQRILDHKVTSDEAANVAKATRYTSDTYRYSPWSPRYSPSSSNPHPFLEPRASDMQASGRLWPTGYTPKRVENCVPGVPPQQITAPRVVKSSISSEYQERLSSSSKRKTPTPEDMNYGFQASRIVEVDDVVQPSAGCWKSKDEQLPSKNLSRRLEIEAKRRKLKQLKDQRTQRQNSSQPLERDSLTSLRGDVLTEKRNPPKPTEPNSYSRAKYNTRKRKGNGDSQTVSNSRSSTHSLPHAAGMGLESSVEEEEEVEEAEEEEEVEEEEEEEEDAVDLFFSYPNQPDVDEPLPPKEDVEMVICSVDTVGPDDSSDLSPSQRQGLWWQGYLVLSSDHPSLFLMLEELLSREFGSMNLKHHSDRAICTNISTLVKRACSANLEYHTALAALIESRANIIRIITTIDDSLGLEIATLGWTFLSLLLTIFDPLLTANPPTSLSADSVSSLTTAFQQLQEIGGIVARYAVMENLYNQKGASLTLRPEYQASLLDLCVTILQYFSHAFVFAKVFGDTAGESQPLVQASVRRRDELVEEIKEKDKACQGFRVLVEAGEYSDSDSEELDDDVSDESGNVASSGLKV
ncbi:uncharacterized protein BP5553_01846 [Venustampulla echinocandica]|uniref:Fungal N-terminal domain-containing protein n=1 Tax=Venustampulla echinocandica TaxID=2656787 RepID=A0A370U266_9HELO|nr:uncharacterized protein BP5553_01846 [Venustampulla echinocandica]RDL41867.1 hypothetical protein BP5553_01846 [Venustampulla echinocandica]